MLKAVQNSLLSLIYPHECRVCGCEVNSLDTGSVCKTCWASTRIFEGTEMLCNKCGAFFGEEAAPVPVFCHKCDEHFYDKAVAVGIYEAALASSIIDLKASPALSKWLRTAINDTLLRIDVTNTDLIIPIPLSKLRSAERGFNQAEVIASVVGRATGIPIDPLSLTRTIHTPIHRAGMDQKARELSVRNVFNVRRPKLIAGKNILLVDDVFTSGATSSNCAKVLKMNGSGRVNVFTLARAVLN